MPLLDGALFLTAALIAGALLDTVARRRKWPLSLLLMVAGFVVSETIVGLGFDTGLRWYNFNELVFYGLVPLLIFETASRLDRGALLREWRAIALMSGPVLLAATAVTAAFLYAGVGHASGFPVATALLAAALLAAIDPTDVVELAGGNRAAVRGTVVLEGESVFSDVLAVTLFATFMSGALMHREHAGLSDAAIGFVWSVAVGIAIGTMAGMAARALRPALRGGAVRALTLAAIAYAAFVSCQYFAEGSGAIAVLATALLANPSNGAKETAERATIEAIGWSARVVLFLMAGATVTTFMFRDQWLAMMIAIAAVSCARLTVVEGALLLANRFRPSVPRFDASERLLVCAGGVRGAIVLALALSLPLELESWYTVQSMAYGVVLFTLAVHPLAARKLMRRGAPGGPP